VESVSDLTADLKTVSGLHAPFPLMPGRGDEARHGSDLDLAPRPMHVDADEEIDSAVAAVLVIVTFELTRLGRDRLAYLADQLDRAYMS
jgi:hypothetical protein